MAALERIATTAVIAEHAVMHGNEPGLILVIRHRLPRVLQELAMAFQALIATVIARPVASAVGFAC